MVSSIGEPSEGGSDESLEVMRKLLEALKKDDFQTIHEMLWWPIKLLLTKTQLEKQSQSLSWMTGPIESYSKIQHHQAGYFPSVKALVRYQKMTYGLVAKIGPGNSIVGYTVKTPIFLGLTEPWKTPEYVDEAAFTEHEFRLNPFWVWSGVGARLAIPKQEGRKPAILLLPGSGVSDLDICVGAEKPAKDLAWGLASKGIVVMRVGKPKGYLAYKEHVSKDVTVEDEYLYQGLASLKLLSKHPEVDASQIYVAGLSLGGRFAPRLCKASTVAVAGIISLAGLSQRYIEALIGQAKYHQKFNPKDEAEFQKELNAGLELSEGLKDGSITVESKNPLQGIPISLPLSYFIDDEENPPGPIAATLDTRILILQGTDDWQVTAEENLAVWREHLQTQAAAGTATFKVYDGLNHLFMRHSKTEVGIRQYDEPLNMAEDPIRDIVQWIMHE